MANLLLKNVLSYSPKLTFSIFNRLNVFSEINGSLKKKVEKNDGIFSDQYELQLLQ